MSSLFQTPQDRELERRLQRQAAKIGASIVRRPPPDWSESPFAAFKAQSPKVTGDMFARLISEILSENGIDVVERRARSNGRILNGLAVDFKGATLSGSGGFTFNQIRDEDYHHYNAGLLLGIERERVSVWVESKEYLRKRAANQHGGEDVTKALRVKPPTFMQHSDGSLVTAIAVLRDRVISGGG